jgi:hypothetical protein
MNNNNNNSSRHPQENRREMVLLLWFVGPIVSGIGRSKKLGAILFTST